MFPSPHHRLSVFLFPVKLSQNDNDNDLCSFPEQALRHKPTLCPHCGSVLDSCYYNVVSVQEQLKDLQSGGFIKDFIQDLWQSQPNTGSGLKKSGSLFGSPNNFFNMVESYLNMAGYVFNNFLILQYLTNIIWLVFPTFFSCPTRSV